MNHHETNRYNMFVSVRQFGADNAADFPAGSIGATQFAEVGAVITQLEGLGSQQSGGMGEARMGYANKDTARENLREAMAEIARTAASMEYQFPGISEMFEMPRGMTDQKLVAAANAFIAAMSPYEDAFIQYGLSDEFLGDLTNDITAFQQSMKMTASGRDAHVAATAEIGTVVRRGMQAVRILDGVVKNKYRDNVGKLAAWTSASHIERAPQAATTPTPPQP